MADQPEKTEENADFERGLYVCEHPGHEFAGAGSSGAAIGLFGTQVFAMLFLIPLIGFLTLRNVLGMSTWIAGIVAGVLMVIVVTGGIVMLLRINQGNRSKGTGQYFSNESDSRFRVRVVIPKKKQEARIVEWAKFVSEEAIADSEEMTTDQLEMIRGGFEPMIVRPWFGLKRDRRYWWTFGIMSTMIGFGLMVLLTQLIGSWKDVMQAFGFAGYAGMGLIMVGGIVSAEMLWPVYVRLVPGRLDIFRYGFLGSGTPKVDRFDLRTVGVCVDFGSFIASLEPARPIGDRLPKLVQAKRWPHAQAFPEDYKPMYIAMAMTSNRRLFAQRLIQAARTDEPTPPVSDDRLGE